MVEKLKADICLITSQKPLFGQCVINIAIADADSDIWHCITLRDNVPKNESSAIIYSIMTTLFCGTEKKYIWKNVIICTVKISGDLIDLHVVYRPKHKVIEF